MYDVSQPPFPIAKLKYNCASAFMPTRTAPAALASVQSTDSQVFLLFIIYIGIQTIKVLSLGDWDFSAQRAHGLFA